MYPKYFLYPYQLDHLSYLQFPKNDCWGPSACFALSAVNERIAFAPGRSSETAKAHRG
eukprot:TRINITY_DN4054_c0_g1_i1.p1 TRINITY_DN4054_c0_g1~~TRINITY_DN4054_c0_g1_i1.p1  ORF type:complete len:58 (+),score=15.07 TRINITY_DN4054_c0_g1_i1:183-356(+)